MLLAFAPPLVFYDTTEHINFVAWILEAQHSYSVHVIRGTPTANDILERMARLRLPGTRQSSIIIVDVQTGSTFRIGFSCPKLEGSSVCDSHGWYDDRHAFNRAIVDQLVVDHSNTDSPCLGFSGCHIAHALSEFR